MTTEHFDCQCYSDEHTLRFMLEEHDAGDPEIYTSVFLGDYPRWWERVWVAIKYIFGYKCKYGHFDCFIMRAEDVDRMMTLLEKFRELALQPKKL